MSWVADSRTVAVAGRVPRVRGLAARGALVLRAPSRASSRCSPSPCSWRPCWPARGGALTAAIVAVVGPHGGRRRRAQQLPRTRPRRPHGAHPPAAHRRRHARAARARSGRPARQRRRRGRGVGLRRRARRRPSRPPAPSTTWSSTRCCIKPRTAFSSLPGGLAGVFPALIGWTAAGGGLAGRIVFVCALIAVWSPPHFWALAFALQDEYLASGVPTPPVVLGERAATRLIFAAAAVLVALTLAPSVDRALPAHLPGGGGRPRGRPAGRRRRARAAAPPGDRPAAAQALGAVPRRAARRDGDRKAGATMTGEEEHSARGQA